MDKKYNHYKLDNGMEIVLIPDDSVYSVNVSAKVRSGSVLEVPNQAGLTHFVEHMSLTATEKWPEKKSLNQLAEWNGANFNAATSKEYLKYYITTPYNKLEYGVDFINQALYHTVFKEENIEIERTVILDEYSKDKDNIYACFDEFYNSEIIDSKYEYKTPVIGKIENLKQFTKQDLEAFQETAHDPSRILLSVVGNFKIDEAKRYIDQYFDNIKSQNKASILPTIKTYNSLNKVKADNKTELIITTLLFDGMELAINDIHERALYGLSLSILCGPSSSRLFSRLREKEGLLYSITPYRFRYKTLGIREILFEQQPKLYEKTLNIILEEITNYYEKGITQEELDHIKEYLINTSLVKFDGVFSYSPLILEPIFKGEKVFSIEELHKATKQATLKDVNQFIKKSMDPKKLNILSYGNVDDKIVDTIIKTRKTNKC